VTQAPLRPASADLARRSGGATALGPRDLGPQDGRAARRDLRAARRADLRADRRAATGSRRPWVVALVVYAAVVAVVVAWPTPVDAAAHGTLTDVLDRLHDVGVPRWVDYDLVERAANVAMFVPLGLLVTRVTRHWWWGLAVPAALSGAAELTQHLLRPERFATWTDVATNTSGAALGVVVAVVLMRRRARARAALV
jgi:VanZ family protein